jgi:hypothetical protein
LLLFHIISAMAFIPHLIFITEIEKMQSLLFRASLSRSTVGNASIKQQSTTFYMKQSLTTKRRNFCSTSNPNSSNTSKTQNEPMNCHALLFSKKNDLKAIVKQLDSTIQQKTIDDSVLHATTKDGSHMYCFDFGPIIMWNSKANPNSLTSLQNMVLSSEKSNNNPKFAHQIDAGWIPSK